MIKLKLASILAILLILSGSYVNGQKIFREGYVMKTGGEVLNGLVEYSNNQDVPAVCKFKRFDIAVEVSYGPDDIKGFGYKNGNRYEAETIDGNTSFYEVLILGKIVLYQKKGKFYLDKDHAGLVELASGPVSYYGGGQTHTFKNLPEFLRYITEGKAGDITDRFDLKNEIIPLVTAYNKQSGISYYTYNRTMSESEISQRVFQSGAYKNRFGLIAGVNLYQLNLNCEREIGLPVTGLETGPAVGLTFERIISRKSDRISVRLDIMYSKKNFYSYTEETDYTERITTKDSYFEYAGIKVPVLGQYSFTGHRIIPYFNLGFACQYLINKDYLRIEAAENFQHDIIITEYRDMFFKPVELSGVGGIGIKTKIYNNVSLNILGRVEVGTGIFETEINGQIFTQNSIQSSLLIGIIF